jgi:hypothetical protein
VEIRNNEILWPQVITAMNWNFRNIWTVYFVLVVAGLLAVAGAAQQETAVVVRDEIFGTQEAAELVQQARSFDPRYCAGGQRLGRTD